MKNKVWLYLIWAGALALGCAPLAQAQSGMVRPRRVRPMAENVDSQTTRSNDDSNTTASDNKRNTAPPDATPTPTARPRARVVNTADAGTNAPDLANKSTRPRTSAPDTTAGNSSGTVNDSVRPRSSAPSEMPPGDTGNIIKGDTKKAYTLLQQKQYAAALTEARTVATQFPNDPEAWKIAGFAELSLKQYLAAANDLQKSYDLKKDDTNVFDALAQSYFFAEKFPQALPLLVMATGRATPKADPVMLFYRGVAEYRTGKLTDAEKTFNEVVKANPKDTGALYFLGQFAYERNDLPAAVNWLNRVTVNDPNASDAWRLLTSAYLRRASTATETTQAEADYLSATKAGEQLTRLSQDTDDSLLYAQALIGSAQYAKAIPLLERAATVKKDDGQVMFMLGAAHLRAKNYPKAITAFEQAARLTPKEINIYRELGYAYEAQRQYAKALAAYQKGAALAPGDAYFQESIARVKPFAK